MCLCDNRGRTKSQFGGSAAGIFSRAALVCSEVRRCLSPTLAHVLANKHKHRGCAVGPGFRAAADCGAAALYSGPDVGEGLSPPWRHTDAKRHLRGN